MSGPVGKTVVNPLRGEFEAILAGEVRQFDTRLATVAVIEAACGNRAVVDVLNSIILGRRAQEQMALIAAALAAADPQRQDAEHCAANATVGEAEAFILALVFALGFTVSAPEGAAPKGERRDTDPLAGPSAGDAGGSSRSAA